MRLVMPRTGGHDGHRRCQSIRFIAAVFIVVVVLFGTTGLSCDNNASAAFRQEAAGQIGDGVKTIVDAVIDGLVAAVEQAGDGSSTSSGG